MIINHRWDPDFDPQFLFLLFFAFAVISLFNATGYRRYILIFVLAVVTLIMFFTISVWIGYYGLLIATLIISTALFYRISCESIGNDYRDGLKLIAVIVINGIIAFAVVTLAEDVFLPFLKTIDFG